MEELARGEAREEPTAAEAEFGEQLEALLTPKLGFYFWTDRDGAPWMVAYLTFMTGAASRDLRAVSGRPVSHH